MAYIVNEKSNVPLIGSTSADTIYNGGRVTVDDEYYYYNGGTRVTISSYGGNDYIYNNGMANMPQSTRARVTIPLIVAAPTPRS